MLNQLLPSIGALALVAFNGFAVAQEDNIVTVAVDNGFEVLASALTAANLVGALQDPDANYTVFAPTDEAFAAVPQPILNWLLTPAGESALTDILLYHVVDGEFFSTDLSNGTIVPTLQGSTVEFTIDETVMVNDATVLIADVDASNGVIHVIDQVLIPEDLVFPKDIVDLAVDAGSFTMLVAAIEAAGLIDTLKGTGPFTVFAPTDDAFNAAVSGLPAGVADFVFANPSVLAGILTYHVVPGAVLSTDLVENTTVTTVNGADLEIEISLDGTTITINDATVVAADLMPLNGVIHVIDELLLPPDFAIPSDIVTTAVQSGSFPALVAALAAADLVDALAYPGGPYTVFAPTEAAFASLPFGILNKLLLPENKDTLTQILLQHVVNGQVVSSDLVDGMSVDTLQGGNFTVEVGNDGEVTLEDGAVTVVTADILTTNGVIHVIDSVLIPAGITLPAADTCSLEDNICGTKGGDNKYNYCFFDTSKDEAKTKCDTEEKFLDLKEEDYIVNCGCCADDADCISDQEPVEEVVVEEEEEETDENDEDRRHNLRR